MLLKLAKDFGLNDEILEKAKSMLTSNVVHTEELLQSIFNDKKKIEEEKEKILQNSLEIEVLKQKLQEDTTVLDEKAKGIIEDAKAEAKNILLSAKDNANEIIRQLESAVSVSNANKLRNKLNEKIAENAPIQPVSNTPLDSKDVQIGKSVRIIPLGQVATILSLPNKSGEVLLQAQNSKMYFKLSDLAPSEPISQTMQSKSKPNSSFKASSVSSEMNVIGLTVEEANAIIDKYLDDAYLSKLSEVRIIHGKGTGALRKGIHAFLKRHPHVESFRLGTFGEGEMGVTVVKLN